MNNNFYEDLPFVNKNYKFETWDFLPSSGEKLNFLI